jgi:hypothetical protein
VGDYYFEAERVTSELRKSGFYVPRHFASERKHAPQPTASVLEARTDTAKQRALTDYLLKNLDKLRDVPGLEQQRAAIEAKLQAWEYDAPRVLRIYSTELPWNE